jgi:hypothetical protein
MPRHPTIDISELRDEYVVCRAIGHSWDDNPTAEVDGPLFRAATGCLALRCVRCTTERFDYIDSEMQVFQRYYRYPPQYQSIPGQETRPNLRGELLRRSVLIRRYGNGRRRRAEPNT